MMIPAHHPFSRVHGPARECLLCWIFIPQLTRTPSGILMQTPSLIPAVVTVPVPIFTSDPLVIRSLQ